MQDAENHTATSSRDCEVAYTSSLRGITATRLRGFFVGWPNPPSPEKQIEIFLASDHVVIAIDSSSKRVVGFITAITDGILSAYIPLLEVLPEFQGRGIGRELVSRMLDKLGDLYMIDLMCDLNVREFYEKFGMKAAFGMTIRNFDRQAGE